MTKKPAGPESSVDEAAAEAALLAELAGSQIEAAPASADQTPPTEEELRALRGEPGAVAASQPLTVDDAPEASTADGEAELDEDGTPRLHAILSNAEVLAIQNRARARVDKDERDSAADLLLKAEIEKEKRRRGLLTNSPEDEIESVYLDLAEHSDRITLNGVVYFHGRRYDVPRHVARTMKEIMFRGWQHQIIDIDGKSRRDFYRRSYDTRLGGDGSVLSGRVAEARA